MQLFLYFECPTNLLAINNFIGIGKLKHSEVVQQTVIYIYRYAIMLTYRVTFHGDFIITLSSEPSQNKYTLVDQIFDFI